MDVDQYDLSLSLVLPDGEPVRALCHIHNPPTASVATSSSTASATDDDTLQNTTLVAGSQGALLTHFAFVPDDDTTADEDASTTVFNTTMFRGGHSHQITALLATKASGGYVSGCKDGNIRVFDGATEDPIHTLTGHEKPVTSLSWVTLTGSDDRVLLASGSWDGSARLWDLETACCVCVMAGHENTVSVQGLAPASNPGMLEGKAGAGGRRGFIATGSAGVAQGNQIVETKIRLWDLVEDGGGLVTATIKTKVADHGGPIRGLCLDNDTQCLASCSNDGTIKIRDSGTAEAIFSLQHPTPTPPLILGVAAIGAGKYVSVTEDGNAAVWDTASDNIDTPKQILGHPGCVWTVLSLPNGDFATGCHDGTVRIFTSCPSRKASSEDIAALEAAATASKAKSSSGPSSEEIAKLPRWDMRAVQTGRSDGQVQVFQRDGKAIAAQWSATSSTWIEVGEVTGSNENAGAIDGVSYDHVFPIEIDLRGGGVTTLKIGYNNGDNPFVTAQKFIDDHELDQNYLAQIADYIRQRTGASAPTLGMDASSGNTSAAPSMPSSSSTGNSASTSSAGEPVYKHIPMKHYLVFDAGAEKTPMQKVMSKLVDFSKNADGKSGAAELSPDNLSTLELLASTIVATNRYHSTTISDQELDLIVHLLKTWPTEYIFPLLDLARLVVLHPNASAGANRRKYVWEKIVPLALAKCSLVSNGTVEGKTSNIAIPMLSMRFFVNCFKSTSSDESAGTVVAPFLDGIVDCAKAFSESPNKNIRLSVATLALNVSCFLMKQEASLTKVTITGVGEKIISLIQSMLSSGLYDNEATSRAFVALGTVLLISSMREKVMALDSNTNSITLLFKDVEKYGEKATAVAKEIQLVLKS
eukprot:CAMPEP_0194365742 /NCGR_PEP_ID=MMETSP0174-20130528/13772_1 /TAXON_ID=216777 /ORGANISM="Proboscia alata, Strain PI-D3" /LENGTH=868 /DNA_ID=CAMNT_0039140575 /DNA_START=60 /DNA_END=2666 /DNA_ORIENTATION=-